MQTVNVSDGKGGELVFTHDNKYKIELLKVVEDRIVGWYTQHGTIVPSTWDFGGEQRYEFGGVDLQPYDKFKDLKKAYSEGCRLECMVLPDGGWIDKGHTTWEADFNYRIKGNISIQSWNKHKDVIKAYWEGCEVEYLGVLDGKWWKVEHGCLSGNTQYRVKQQVEELTLEQVCEALGKDIKIIKGS